MRAIIAPLHAAVKTLMATLDTDTETLNAYLTVQKMAETNEEEKRLYVLDFISLLSDTREFALFQQTNY